MNYKFNSKYFGVVFFLILQNVSVNFLWAMSVAIPAVNSCTQIESTYDLQLDIPFWAQKCIGLQLKDFQNYQIMSENLLDVSNKFELSLLNQEFNKMRSKFKIDPDTIVVNIDPNYKQFDIAMSPILDNLLTQYLKLNFILKENMLVFDYVETTSENKVIFHENGDAGEYFLSNKQIESLSHLKSKIESMLLSLKSRFPQVFSCSIIDYLFLTDSYIVKETISDKISQLNSFNSQDFLDILESARINFILSDFDKVNLLNPKEHEEDFPMGELVELLFFKKILSTDDVNACIKDDILNLDSASAQIKSCYGSAIKEVINLNPYFQNDGTHINGSGNTECSFIKAKWEAKNGEIKHIKGEFIGREANAVKKVLECDNIKLKIVNDKVEDVFFKIEDCKESILNSQNP